MFVSVIPAGLHTSGAISSRGCSMLNTVGRGSLYRKKKVINPSVTCYTQWFVWLYSTLYQRVIYCALICSGFWALLSPLHFTWVGGQILTNAWLFAMPLCMDFFYECAYECLCVPRAAELCVIRCVFTLQQKSKLGCPDIWDLKET